MIWCSWATDDPQSGTRHNHGMRLIFPMAGQGGRFRAAGYTDPKPLIPVSGRSLQDRRPIIEHLLAQFPAAWPKVFVVNREHLEQSRLGAILEALAPGSVTIAIEPHRRGPVHTLLEAARIAPEALPDDEPCLVNYCDFSFTWDADRFEQFTIRTRCDGAVLCYSGHHPEYLRPTLYAYCRTHEGRVLEVREKGYFTDDRRREYASSGSYYFRSGALLRQYGARLMSEGPLLDGEGYVSLVYNHLIRDGLDVRVYEIPWFMQWGTPADIADYEYWVGVYAKYRLGHRGQNQSASRERRALQLLMPMAGQGSRFGAGTAKFLRSVPALDQPMFKAAIDHLPLCDPQVLVVQEAHAENVRVAAPTARVVGLSGPTEGQAVTCALACEALLPEVPVLVSSCDHGMVWDDERWQALLDEDPDVVVWGQRGYPGADATPGAFAYIVTDGNASGGAERVLRVSVKQPLGPDPRRDLLLVGTFYFKRPALLAELIAELRARDIRVNGELYLDSVVDLAVARGLSVRAFEADGYLCWGSPEALRDFNFWHAWYTGHAAPPGPRAESAAQ